MVFCTTDHDGLIPRWRVEQLQRLKPVSHSHFFLFSFCLVGRRRAAVDHSGKPCFSVSRRNAHMGMKTRYMHFEQ